ncbi:hypothetical protein F0919_17095 [Taibaiella lutea]|uniref:Uncharacterized protein n=1 Tax=Taibaiella lutea TaxID=2608001 RepID=A0A5M6CDG5_9BACT|nr:hypothetical protein [Taibaiella lutea]KAA5532500.1 hypothetical protein F0919_17095 [Taibaiella lutea]
MAHRKSLYNVCFYKPFLCLLLLAGFEKAATAQSVQANTQNYVTISDTSQLVYGATFPVVFKISCYGGGAVLPNWKMTIQPLTAYLIPAQTSSEVAQFGPAPNWPIKYFGVKFNPGNSQSSWSNGNSTNLIGAVSSTIPLSGSELTLVQQSNYAMVASDYFSMAYDFVLLGNRQMLLLHRDNYSVVLRVRLYNQSNTLLSQYDLNLQLGIWPQYNSIPVNVPQYPNLIQLQNGSGNVSLGFSSDLSFSQGVEATVSDGLKVSSNDGRYEIKVQAAANYFSKSGALTTIPVNTLKLTPTQGSTVISTSTYTPVNLSSSQQTLITNLGSEGRVNYYNLNYSTKYNSNQSAFIGIESGVYTTQVTFIMNPL